jgi:hypothetical protein
MSRSDNEYEDDDDHCRRRLDDDNSDDYQDGNYEDDDCPRRRRSDALDPVEFIVPTDVSGWSIVACYVGLISCFLPFVGIFPAVVAITCGIIALRKRKKAITYGRVTSDLRAIVGVVLGGLTLVIHLTIFTLMASGIIK